MSGGVGNLNLPFGKGLCATDSSSASVLLKRWPSGLPRVNVANLSFPVLLNIPSQKEIDLCVCI